jgi:hypothetical protein
MTGLSQSELVVAAEAPASPTPGRTAALPDGDRLEVARVARDRSGSYQELEKALERMREEAYGSYHLVMHVLVYGEPILLTQGASDLLDEAVEWLARTMRSVRVPRAALDSPDKQEARKTSMWRGRTKGHSRQRAERNAAILSEYQEGQSAIMIAASYGVTREHVHRIVREA